MEVDWLACDLVDQIAFLSTAGFGLAPRAVEDNLELYLGAVRAILARPMVGPATCELELAPGLTNTWKLAAERGVFALDYDSHSGRYAMIAVPSRRITLRDVPAELAEAIAMVRFRTLTFEQITRFSDTDLDHLTG
ncbi:MAG TPA: hypothetical protein VLT45_20140 [Kofleriaceae bacterium]|nr:hypothetical protein [Kofleriaceae bacterium]